MKLNEAFEIYIEEEDLKLPKNIKEIKHIKRAGDDEVFTYEGPAPKMKYKDRRNNKWYDFKVKYQLERTWIVGGPGDPDSVEVTTWTKMYELTMDDGMGVMAFSTRGPNKFSTTGYKDWEIFLFYTQSDGRPMMSKHFKKAKMTVEKKMIEKMYDALDTLSTRRSLFKQKDTHINDKMDVIDMAYESLETAYKDPIVGYQEIFKNPTGRELKAIIKASTFNSDVRFLLADNGDVYAFSTDITHEDAKAEIKVQHYFNGMYFNNGEGQYHIFVDTYGKKLTSKQEKHLKKAFPDVDFISAG